MGSYEVAVTTGSMVFADSDGYAYISLIGTEGESEIARLDHLCYIGEVSEICRGESKDYTDVK